VGFAFNPSDTGWLGGVNYLRNLICSVSREPVGIEPVAVVPSTGNAPSMLAGIGEIRTRLFCRRSLARWARLGIREVIGRDVLTEQLLRTNGIQAFSHSGLLGIGSRFPTINWITDLQHRRLPAFFEPKLLRARDKAISRVCRASTLIIVSSECARRDLEAHFPVGRERIRVLRFVDSSASEVEAIDRVILEERYQFKGPYFYVPNQFWVHKNHGVIIEALRILKSRGRRVQVLATGNTADYRRPDYFRQLMQRRAEAGVESEFRCLGILPYEDVVNLARGAVTLINPSLFEGWSTSVEEAKSLGKAILLSDLDVHREQAPERGAYFGANDADALAELMWREWDSFDPGEDARAARAATQQLPDRRLAFARTYAAIVKEAIARE
jgi:glycosyltransferase involved in cell wall biosynthesis